ncbi:MAG: hypothetical protein IKU72_02020 [Oscillospiraceae bacterium]|nr:hypothetical protein [Oscillospiraceae bacterium]
MAAVNIEPKKIMRNSLTMVNPADFVAVNAADGAVVPMFSDSRLLIVCHNSGSGSVTATVVKGNALQGAGSDLTLQMTAGGYAFAVVESGLYGNTSGELRGKICLKGSSANLQVAAYHMPE